MDDTKKQFFYTGSPQESGCPCRRKDELCVINKTGTGDDADLGGPLVAKRNDRWTVLGIASHIKFTVINQLNVPVNIFTKVFVYRNWIIDAVDKDPNRPSNRCQRYKPERCQARHLAKRYYYDRHSNACKPPSDGFCLVNNSQAYDNIVHCKRCMDSNATCPGGFQQKECTDKNDYAFPYVGFELPNSELKCLHILDVCSIDESGFTSMEECEKECSNVITSP